MGISAKTGLAILAAAFLATGCTTGGQVRNDSPQPPPPPPKQVDPMAGLKARFEAAYFEIACQASGGKDPLSSVTPIEQPTQYLERIENVEGGKRDRAEKSAMLHGFRGISDLREVIQKMKADKKYWQTVQDRYIDELIKCAQ